MLLYLYDIETKFTLNREERLKSRKLIEQLFSSGKSYSSFPIKALYQLSDGQSGVHLKAGVAVSKRNFKKAVDRNRVKRILREAYRLQKAELETSLSNSGKQLALFLIFTGKELPQMDEMREKLKFILNELKKITTAR